MRSTFRCIHLDMTLIIEEILVIWPFLIQCAPVPSLSLHQFLLPFLASASASRSAPISATASPFALNAGTMSNPSSDILTASMMIQNAGNPMFAATTGGDAASTNPCIDHTCTDQLGVQPSSFLASMSVSDAGAAGAFPQALSAAVDMRGPPLPCEYGDWAITPMVYSLTCAFAIVLMQESGALASISLAVMLGILLLTLGYFSAAEPFQSASALMHVTEVFSRIKAYIFVIFITWVLLSLYTTLSAHIKHRGFAWLYKARATAKALQDAIVRTERTAAEMQVAREAQVIADTKREVQQVTLGYVAHRLNGPLHTCLNIAADLSTRLRGRRDEVRDLRELRRELNRMSSLTRDVLMHQSLLLSGAAGVTLQQRPVSITTFVAQLRRIASSALRREIREVIEGNVPSMVSMDPLYVSQALTTALKNAAESDDVAGTPLTLVVSVMYAPAVARVGDYNQNPAVITSKRWLDQCTAATQRWGTWLAMHQQAMMSGFDLHLGHETNASNSATHQQTPRTVSAGAAASTSSHVSPRVSQDEGVTQPSSATSSKSSRSAGFGSSAAEWHTSAPIEPGWQWWLHFEIRNVGVGLPRGVSVEQLFAPFDEPPSTTSSSSNAAPTPTASATVGDFSNGGVVASSTDATPRNVGSDQALPRTSSSSNVVPLAGAGGTDATTTMVNGNTTAVVTPSTVQTSSTRLRHAGMGLPITRLLAVLLRGRVGLFDDVTMDPPHIVTRFFLQIPLRVTADYKGPIGAAHHQPTSTASTMTSLEQQSIDELNLILASLDFDESSDDGDEAEADDGDYPLPGLRAPLRASPFGNDAMDYERPNTANSVDHQQLTPVASLGSDGLHASGARHRRDDTQVHHLHRTRHPSAPPTLPSLVYEPVGRDESPTYRLYERHRRMSGSLASTIHSQLASKASTHDEQVGSSGSHEALGSAGRFRLTNSGCQATSAATTITDHFAASVHRPAQDSAAHTQMSAYAGSSRPEEQQSDVRATQSAMLATVSRSVNDPHRDETQLHSALTASQHPPAVSIPSMVSAPSFDSNEKAGEHGLETLSPCGLRGGQWQWSVNHHSTTTGASATTTTIVASASASTSKGLTVLPSLATSQLHANSSSPMRSRVLDFQPSDSVWKGAPAQMVRDLLPPMMNGSRHDEGSASKLMHGMRADRLMPAPIKADPNVARLSLPLPNYVSDTARPIVSAPAPVSVRGAAMTATTDSSSAPTTITAPRHPLVSPAILSVSAPTVSTATQAGYAAALDLENGHLSLASARSMRSDKTSSTAIDEIQPVMQFRSHSSKSLVTPFEGTEIPSSSRHHVLAGVDVTASRVAAGSSSPTVRTMTSSASVSSSSRIAGIRKRVGAAAARVSEEQTTYGSLHISGGLSAASPSASSCSREARHAALFIRSPAASGAAMVADSSSTSTPIGSRTARDGTGSSSSTPGLGLNILVVDDMSTVRKMNARLLRQLGCSAVCLSDGSEAIEYIQNLMTGAREPIHAILMDIVMDKVNGDEACIRIRSLGWTGVIIAATGNYLPADQARYRSIGFTDVLGKPFDVKDLNGVLSRHCCSNLAPTSAALASTSSSSFFFRANSRDTGDAAAAGMTSIAQAPSAATDAENSAAVMVNDAIPTAMASTASNGEGYPDRVDSLSVQANASAQVVAAATTSPLK